LQVMLRAVSSCSFMCCAAWYVHATLSAIEGRAHPAAQHHDRAQRVSSLCALCRDHEPLWSYRTRGSPGDAQRECGMEGQPECPRRSAWAGAGKWSRGVWAGACKGSMMRVFAPCMIQQKGRPRCL
jgi:hypothetical protein